MAAKVSSAAIAGATGGERGGEDHGADDHGAADHDSADHYDGRQRVLPRKPSSPFRAIDRGDARATFSDGAHVLARHRQPAARCRADRDAPLDVRAGVDARSSAEPRTEPRPSPLPSPRDYYLLGIASGQRYNVAKYTAGKPRSLVEVSQN